MPKLPVLSLLSSHRISLTCGFCCFLLSAREGNGHLLSTYCMPDNLLTLSSPLNFPCSFISDFSFLLHLVFLGGDNMQLWSAYCMPCN